MNNNKLLKNAKMCLKLARYDISLIKWMNIFKLIFTVSFAVKIIFFIAAVITEKRKSC